MSTRYDEKKRGLDEADQTGSASSRHLETLEDLAIVASAKREVLLRVHGYRLRREDLEDCYSQAVLELLARAGSGGFANRRHMANVIEQRFLSRIHDRRRALSGRSPIQAAVETALSLDAPAAEEVQVADRTELEQLVILREELQLVHLLSRELTRDQRLVIASQVSLQMQPGEFCRLHGWSAEKYRKVAQRGRARLRALVDRGEHAVPSFRELSEGTSGTDL